MFRYVLLLALFLQFPSTAHAEHNGGTPGPTGSIITMRGGVVLPLE